MEWFLSRLLPSYLFSLSVLPLEPQPQATEQEGGSEKQDAPEGQSAETQPEPEVQPQPEEQPAEIEPADPQPTEPQKDEVKEGGGEPEAKETEPASQGEKGEEKGEEKVEDEPKPKPLPPRTRVRTIVPEEGVDVALGESGLEAEEPVTVGKLFQDAVKRIPTNPALKYKEDGVWKTITFSGYYDLCVKAAKSFLKVRVGLDHP